MIHFLSVPRTFFSESCLSAAGSYVDPFAVMIYFYNFKFRVLFKSVNDFLLFGVDNTGSDKICAMLHMLCNFCRKRL